MMTKNISTSVSLNGRQVLVISPRFFGYEQRIIRRLTTLGAHVVYVDDRPNNNTFTKMLIRLNARFIQSKLDKYHEKQINQLCGRHFDDLLFIVPESCSSSTIQRYKNAFPSAKLLLYMWDSFDNKKRKAIPFFLKLFDRTYSFDQKDCTTYGMRFRPLFFSFDAKTLRTSHGFDLSFIGTIHSDRYLILKNLKLQAHDRGLKFFIYPYLPSSLHYWLYRFTKLEFLDVPRSDLKFVPLPYPDVLRVMDESAAIVDIEHPGQRGLTMRTLEVIGAGKKLITTNANVVHYSFYSPERVQIIDRKAPSIAANFFETQPDPLPPATLAFYSLDGWIEDILLITS